jgi:hypothetical protein
VIQVFHLASNPAFTHNATRLILRDGITFAGSTGDIVAFVSEGDNNYREMFRRPANGPASSICMSAPPSNVLGNWTAMPVALTELRGQSLSRAYANLAGFHQVRLNANVSAVGASAPVLIGQYLVTEAESGWLDLSSTANQPQISLMTAGTTSSQWMSLTAGAKADVYMRIAGQQGDGLASPRIGNIYLEFR